MMPNRFSALLAMAPPPQPGTQPNPTGEMVKMFGMILIMGFVMYFIMIRPQRQRQKQLEAMLQTLRPGDKVVTSSGIVGIIITVKEKTATLRSGDTKMEVLKNAITEITERSGDNASQS